MIMNITTSQLQIRIQNSVGYQQEITSCNRKFIPWQKSSSCKRKFLPVVWNFVFWDENSFCDRKCLPVTRNFLLWQEISSSDRKFCCVKGKIILEQEDSFRDRKFLPLTGKFWNISSFGYKIETKVCDFLLYLKIATKVHEFCSKHRLRVQGFLPRFFASWPLKSHPVPNSTTTKLNLT